VTPLDRWEEEAGYFASTLAVEIAALLGAAEMAEENGEPEVAEFLRETADMWNAEIESLLYVTDSALAREVGVEGYYVRFAKPNQRTAEMPASGSVTLKNHKAGKGHVSVDEVVSPDALALVRFGLRSADDPRIVNTVRVIDHVLKVTTPHGTSWHRYNHDGYGEHADGSPFDGTGIGRIWPLLTGERGHHELAAGRFDEARRLLKSMEGFANASGLIPEQIWDSEDIPEHQLVCGRPSGSAMPLVWAHAEYLKLRRSLHDRKVFDMPVHAAERYIHNDVRCHRTYWRFEQPCATLPADHDLRIEVLASAEVRWTSDGWKTTRTNSTKDSHLGLHYVDLPTSGQSAGTIVQFTFRWIDADRWEGTTFEVQLTEPREHADAPVDTESEHITAT
jgi:glucoamylase